MVVFGADGHNIKGLSAQMLHSSVSLEAYNI